MTVKEILEAYKGEFHEVEFYVDKFRHRAGFHTDNVEFVESCSEEAEVLEHQLMSEEDYNNTLLANTSQSFSDFYDSEDKILVVKIKKEEQMADEEKEFCGGAEVEYWKVVNKKSKIEAKFKRKTDADAHVVASGCPSLYEVLPVWKENRGGKRPNSGRKPKPEQGKVVTVSFCCTPEQKESLQEAVKVSGLTQSAYIASRLFHFCAE